MMGDFEKGYDGRERVAIRPVSQLGATLPFIAFTNHIADKREGQVQQISGSFDVEVADSSAQELVANIEKSKTVFALALARTADLHPDEIIISQININGVNHVRRLGTLKQRRLASLVRVSYEIITSDMSLLWHDIWFAIDPRILQTNIKEECEKAGLRITFTATPLVGRPVAAVLASTTIVSSTQTTSIRPNTTSPAPNITANAIVSDEPPLATANAPGRFFSILAEMLALGAYLAL